MNALSRYLTQYQSLGRALKDTVYAQGDKTFLRVLSKIKWGEKTSLSEIFQLALAQSENLPLLVKSLGTGSLVGSGLFAYPLPQQEIRFLDKKNPSEGILLQRLPVIWFLVISRWVSEIGNVAALHPKLHSKDKTRLKQIAFLSQKISLGLEKGAELHDQHVTKLVEKGWIPGRKPIEIPLDTQHYQLLKSFMDIALNEERNGQR